eukprot:4041750-Amphidinium_carterae.1
MVCYCEKRCEAMQAQRSMCKTQTGSTLHCFGSQYFCTCGRCIIWMVRKGGLVQSELPLWDARLDKCLLQSAVGIATIPSPPWGVRLHKRHLPPHP